MLKLIRVISGLAIYMLICLFRVESSYSGIDYYVSYLDVGQGDSILIQLNSKTILVDGGGYSYVNHKLDRYLKNDKVIDFLIITHPHDDHYLGLYEVLRRYTVLNVVINPVCVNSSEYIGLLNQLSSSNIIHSKYISFEYYIDDEKLEYMNRMKVNNGEGNGMCVKSSGNLNNDSVITELIFDSKTYLFMGDAEKDYEKDLLTSNLIPSSVYILKAGHHCSDTSTSNIFLERVLPKYVVCSYGKDNKYGHPSMNLIKTLEERYIKILSTEKLGDIIINLSQ